MRIVDDILGSLAADRDALDAPVRDLRVCLHATCVWSRRLGLASTLPRLHGMAGGGHRRPPARLAGRSALELAELARSEDLLEASVGVAAINSLIEPDPAALREGNAYELILSHGEGRDVTVVGHFPFVERLRPRCRNLWVLELMPVEGDLPASSAAECVPRSDVVAITSTALINHTLRQLLGLARQGEPFVILLGPSTPLTPLFFDHGVHALGGSIADRPEEVLRHVSEGVCFKHVAGLRHVLMTRGPSEQ